MEDWNTWYEEEIQLLTERALDEVFNYAGNMVDYKLLKEQASAVLRCVDDTKEKEEKELLFGLYKFLESIIEHNQELKEKDYCDNCETFVDQIELDCGEFGCPYCQSTGYISLHGRIDEDEDEDEEVNKDEKII